MNSVLLSVITPVFNREDVLERCIKSYLGQQTDATEMIIIDDGSNDQSDEVALTYAATKPELISTIRLNSNQGANHARNRGIELSRGEFILFLDSDDYLMEGSLLLVKKYLHLTQYAHHLFPVSYRSNEQAEGIREIRYVDWISGKVKGDFTHVVRRSSFEERLFFEDYADHEDLNWLRIFKFTEPQAMHIEALVAVERNREDSLTTQVNFSTKARILEQFRAVDQKVRMYGNDLSQYVPREHVRLNEKIALLGIALGRIDQAKDSLMKLAPWKGRSLQIIAMMGLGPVLLGTIVGLARVRGLKSLFGRFLRRRFVRRSAKRNFLA